MKVWAFTTKRCISLFYRKMNKIYGCPESHQKIYYDTDAGKYVYRHQSTNTGTWSIYDIVVDTSCFISTIIFPAEKFFLYKLK